MSWGKVQSLTFIFIETSSSAGVSGNVIRSSFIELDCVGFTCTLVSLGLCCITTSYLKAMPTPSKRFIPFHSTPFFSPLCGNRAVIALRSCCMQRCAVACFVSVGLAQVSAGFAFNYCCYFTCVCDTSSWTETYQSVPDSSPNGCAGPPEGNLPLKSLSFSAALCDISVHQNSGVVSRQSKLRWDFMSVTAWTETLYCCW